MIRKTVIATALALGVAGGTGCSSEDFNLKFLDFEDEANLDHAYDKGFVEKTVDDMAAYWQAKGIGMTGVKAVVLQGADKVTNCGPDEITSKSEDMHICGDNRIIVPAQAVNGLRGSHGENSRGAIIGILAHEVGHEVKEQMPELMKNAPADPAARGVFEERLVTCIAGVTIYNRENGAHETEGASQAFLLTGDREHYGGGRAQVSAYNWGYSQMTDDPAKCVNLPPAA